MKLNWVKAGSLGVVALASLWLSTSAPAAVITLEQLHRLELGAAVQTWEIATSSGPRTPSAQPELPPWWHDEQARLLYLVWRGLPTDAAGFSGMSNSANLGFRILAAGGDLFGGLKVLDLDHPQFRLTPVSSKVRSTPPLRFELVRPG
ncbi:MAG: hypothetical protein RMJ16_10415 [Thermoguttaceae bacterium]|nr:hypothetical protein [Thermoguttaceae bacterium]